MNRHVQFSRYGGPEVLELVEGPVREPGEEEVRLRVHALGLNRAEVMYRTNTYTEQAAFPSRIGYEAAGVVEAVGASVIGLRVGDRASTIPGFSLNRHGVAGETAIVPAQHVARIPDSLSFAEGASLWMQYLTAYGTLVEFGKLKAGDFVAITAASSSVGLAAIQMANDAGAVSIAITRGAAKRQGLLRAGAQHVIVTGEEDLVERMRSITGGRGADIVLDPVGGPLLEQLAAIVVEEGLIVEYGWLQPGTPVYPLVPAIVKGFRVQGFHLAYHIAAKPDRLRAGLDYVRPRLESGAFRPLLAELRFPLERIGDAYRYMESNDQLGKIVVEVRP
ncbi:MAG: zinc-dependent alcohol dehydrogenase family protein [Bryobacterales bacterium]|nr:zinc-dependent alcohol dehydrogenase family protein [Bryobacterales bacterium]